MFSTNQDVKRLQTTDQINFESLSDEAWKHVSTDQSWYSKWNRGEENKGIKKSLKKEFKDNVRFPNKIAVCHEYKGRVFVLSAHAIVAWPPVTQTLVLNISRAAGGS